jgi:hypothetical protein
LAGTWKKRPNGYEANFSSFGYFGVFRGNRRPGLPVYNLIAIPAAAGVFIRWGLELPMSVGAMAMNLSTIIVALNAQLLRRLKLGH